MELTKCQVLVIGTLCGPAHLSPWTIQCIIVYLISKDRELGLRELKSFSQDKNPVSGRIKIPG